MLLILKFNGNFHEVHSRMLAFAFFIKLNLKSDINLYRNNKHIFLNAHIKQIDSFVICKKNLVFNKILKIQ